MTNNMTRRTFTAMAAVGAASALLGGCSQEKNEQRQEEKPVEKEPLAVAIKATGWNDKDVWSALSAVPLPREWDEKTKKADGKDPFADHKESYEWATCSGEASVAALGDENADYLVRAYAPYSPTALSSKTALATSSFERGANPQRSPSSSSKLKT